MDARRRQRAGQRRANGAAASPAVAARKGRPREERDREREGKGGKKQEMSLSGRAGNEPSSSEPATSSSSSIASRAEDPSRGDPAEPTARLELGRDVYADILEDEEKYFYLVEALGRVD